MNNGCTPTKALIASAYVAHLARRSAEYGVRIQGEPSIDMQRVKARKDAIVTASSHGVEQWLQELQNARVYRGHARFTGKDTLRVADEELSGERIFVDVGGRPLVPDMPGLDQVRYLTNESMMDVDFVPEHLLVVGGSYVGLEFAQMYRRFGSRVTIIEMGPGLVHREDRDVSGALQDILQAEGVDVRLNTKCLRLERHGADVAMDVDCADREPTVRGSHVLLAVGRLPNTEDLGLDQAGVEMDERGYIRVDDELRTSNPKVWALGDCNGRGAFTHTAYNDYEIVADNILHQAGRKWTDRVPVYALYTDPPLGRVGMSEAEILGGGLRARVGKRPMARVARAVEKGETLGFLKIHVEEGSQRILGAALLGTGADEAVHSLIDAVYARTPCATLQRHVRIHPTVSELLPTVLEDLRPLTHAG